MPHAHAGPQEAHAATRGLPPFNEGRTWAGTDCSKRRPTR